MKHHPTLSLSPLSSLPLPSIHRHCLSLLRCNPRPRYSLGSDDWRRRREGWEGEFPFHLVSPVPKIPSSPRQLISVRCVQLPLLFPSRAPLPEITPLRSTVLANLASHPRTAPRNRSPSQPANSRNQLTASSCYHGSSNAILFRHQTIRMLGNFVGYLFGSNYSGTQDSLEEDPRTRGIMRRFRQVEVEDDEWILIDRTVEGTLEEPWYEMPPAVFTQEGPIKVATSPMENLLIEHPSMSVYSVVSGTSPPVTPDTPPPSPDRWIEGQKDVDVGQTVDVPQNVPPAPPADLSSSTSSALCTVSTSLDSSLDRSNIDELSRRVVAELQAIHNDRLPASDSNNNNSARIGKQLRTAQERAQEMLQKRSTQSLKRARMERSNKVRQAKGKRLRRQDRLRVCHSGANNNRKC